jgi:predicted RNase H-like nuclease
MPRPACPKCGEKQCSRRKREGFFQILIYPSLGWYPWQCSSCRKVFVVKERGKSKRRRKIADLQAIAAEQADREAARDPHAANSPSDANHS